MEILEPVAVANGTSKAFKVSTPIRDIYFRINRATTSTGFQNLADLSIEYKLVGGNKTTQMLNTTPLNAVGLLSLTRKKGSPTYSVNNSAGNDDYIVLMELAPENLLLKPGEELVFTLKNSTGVSLTISAFGVQTGKSTRIYYNYPNVGWTTKSQTLDIPTGAEVLVYSKDSGDAIDTLDFSRGDADNTQIVNADLPYLGAVFHAPIFYNGLLLSDYPNDFGFDLLPVKANCKAVAVNANAAEGYFYTQVLARI